MQREASGCVRGVVAKCRYLSMLICVYFCLSLSVLFGVLLCVKWVRVMKDRERVMGLFCSIISVNCLVRG